MTDFDLREWRDHMGMTQVQVAETLGVSVSWVKAVETGRRGPNGRLLELACEGLAGQTGGPAPSPPAAPPAPAADVAEFTRLIDGLGRLLTMVRGEIQAQARDVAALKAGQRKLLEAAGLPVPREEAPPVFVSARPSVMRGASPAATDFGSLPPLREIDPEEDLTEEERDLAARKAAAEAAREAEEGE